MEGVVPQGTVPQVTLGNAYLDGSTISKTLSGRGSVAEVVKNDGKGDTGNIKGGNGNGGAGNEVVKPVVKNDEVINPAVEGEDDGDELPTNILRNTNEAEAHIDLQINAGMDKRSAVIQAAQMLSQGGRPDLAYDICQKYGVDVQSYTEWMGNH